MNTDDTEISWITGDDAIDLAEPLGQSSVKTTRRSFASIVDISGKIEAVRARFINLFVDAHAGSRSPLQNATATREQIKGIQSFDLE